MVEPASLGPHIGSLAASITFSAGGRLGNALDRGNGGARFRASAKPNDAASPRSGRLDASGEAMPQPAMSTIRTVCVFCGSGSGTDPAFAEAARQFGKLLAENGVGLVYGGGSLRLMGILAASVREHGGRVTGVIPEFLTGREHVMARAQEIIVTRDMHERKRIMFERADAFVALPGGIGTLEELVEQLTWAQLGRHRTPILILNVDGFWEPLCALIDHMRRLDFIRADLSVRLLVVEKVDEILPKLFEEPRPDAEPEKEMVPIVAERM